jgi:DNA transformation protein and related proteins
MPKPIESLPNIGPELAAQLQKIGINTSEELLRVGAMAAWQRLVRAGLRDCLNSLLALEGAIEGVRWQELPIERKEELKLMAVGFSQGN